MCDRVCLVSQPLPVPGRRRFFYIFSFSPVYWTDVVLLFYRTNVLKGGTIMKEELKRIIEKLSEEDLRLVYLVVLELLRGK